MTALILEPELIMKSDRMTSSDWRFMHSRSKRNVVAEPRGETVAWNGRWNDEPVEVHAVSAHHASADIARFIGAQEQERARQEQRGSLQRLQEL